MIGQIKNFMDKDRRVSTETISAQFDVSVGTVHIIIREELKMQKICAKFVPRVLREDQKERRCHDSREMFCIATYIYKYMRKHQPIIYELKWTNENTSL